METLAPTDLIIIDTCIWIPFFNRPASIEKRSVDDLLDEDRAAITGPILAEILQGFRRSEQADWIASSLRGLHFLEPEWDDWRTAARLGSDLTSRGHRLPLTDLLIASLAVRFECAIYTSDPHFDLFANIKRYQPA